MPTSTRTFGTQADDSATGATAWSNPTNAAVSDDSRATVAMSPMGNSHYHKSTNSSHSSGTALASGDIVSSIKYKLERRKSGSGNVRDWKIYPVEGGSVVTATNFADTGTDWGTSDATIEYTQTTNLPTADTILASDWGVVFACQNTNGFSATGELDCVGADVVFTTPVVCTAAAAPVAAHATASASCTFAPKCTATAAPIAAHATCAASMLFDASISLGTAAPIVAHATCSASMSFTSPVFTASAACTAGHATAAALASSIYHATAAPVAAPASCVVVMAYIEPVWTGAAPMTVRPPTCEVVMKSWQRGDWKYTRQTLHQS